MSASQFFFHTSQATETRNTATNPHSQNKRRKKVNVQTTSSRRRSECRQDTQHNMVHRGLPDDHTCPAASVALAGAPDDDQTASIITSRTGDVAHKCGSPTVTRTHAEQGLPRARRRRETTTHLLRADLFYTTTLSLQRRGVTGAAQAAIAAASAAGQLTS
ncbi:hypothetical protein HPB50_024597 [Hyalomma asiaticum]|uniref:Uncharacterized protein n=1 Tax=Hyalomma asiaticum TaxID=266040 RepID=A0ACB7RMR4_HYAAI|nr:hypothetical protein HPB50_024597 [Hyalomma asiaticum]